MIVCSSTAVTFYEWLSSSGCCVWRHVALELEIVCNNDVGVLIDVANSILDNVSGFEAFELWAISRCFVMKLWQLFVH